MAATPPPPEVHTPTAPLHGPLFDQPHIANRKSERIRNQKRDDRTPSPSYNAASFDSEGPGELKRTPKTKTRTSQYLRTAPHHNLSPPSSPLGQDSAGEGFARQSSFKARNGGPFAAGLATPMKTPRKQAVSLSNALTPHTLPVQDDVQRHNFPQIPTPMSKKRGKRLRRSVGFSLDDDLERATGGRGAEIEIYTDSREMIPEADDSADNPFYTRPGGTKKRYPKRQLKPKEAEVTETGLDMLKGDRGYLAVGRGRKFYKTTTDNDRASPSSGVHHDDGHMLGEDTSADADVDDELHIGNDADSNEFSRRSLRPRRLFAEELGQPESPNSQADVSTDDAEATTDIEEPEKHEIAVASSSHRSLRHAAAPSEGVNSTVAHSRVDHGGQGTSLPASPFDSWPRRKPSRARMSAKSGEEAGGKRGGEPLDSASKRVRESA